MKYLCQLFLCTVLGFSTAIAAPKKKESPPNPIEQVTGGIDLGNTVNQVIPKGTSIGVITPSGVIIARSDSNQIIENGPTDIYIAPELLNGAGTPTFGQNRLLSPFDPVYIGQSGMLNRFSAYFSTASGGFGFRLSFDRRISPHLRAHITPEFLTYSFLRSAQILGNQMPANTTRITLFSIPLGLQHQISPQSRVVPHIGFGVGPLIRFDHKSPRPGYYPNSAGIRIGEQNGQNAIGVTVPIFAEDYPEMSLTLGGHVAAGFSVKLGSKKDLGLLLEGRYSVARFTDQLGSPGDFSGFSLGIGFGKHF